MRFLPKILKHILPLLFFGGSLCGQTTLQIVSKKIEKTFPWSASTEVIVEGEKAEIKVETWMRSEISVTLVLTAKHPEKKTAENDLNASEYHFSVKEGKVSLRNFTANKNAVKSNLSANYIIRVPAECPVKMTNYFGKTDVKNLTKNVEIRSEFSPVNVKNITGMLNINSRFGDVVGEFLSGVVKIETQRSDITLKHLQGKFDINAKYGIVKIFADQQQIDLDVNAEKSDVYLFNPEPTAMGYELTAHFGSITVPDDLKLNFIENTEKMRRAIFAAGNRMPEINIRITFGDIIIRDTKP